MGGKASHVISMASQSMTMQSSGRRAVPFVILAVALVLAGAATFYVGHNLARSDRVRFDTTVRETEAKIRERIAIYVAMLRGTQSFCVTNFPPTLETFRKYAAGLDLQTQYPGVQGLGFAVRYASK